MVIAQLHHIGELHLRRWLQPGPDDAQRARALAHIHEFLDNPLDRDVIAEILPSPDPSADSREGCCGEYGARSFDLATECGPSSLGSAVASVGKVRARNGAAR